MNRYFRSLGIGSLFITETGNAIRQNMIDIAFYGYRFLQAIVFSSIALILIGFILNWVGWMGVNIFLCLIFMITFFMLATWPPIFVNAGLFGGLADQIAKNVDIPTALKDSLKAYIKAMQNILFYGSFMLLVLGTISIENNPFAFWVILACIGVLALMSLVWKIKPTFSKKLVYTYVLGMVAFYFLSLVPSEYWYKFFGLDVPAKFAVQQYERHLARIEEAQKQKDNDLNSSILNRIEGRIRKGEQLTQKEEAFLKELQKMRKENSVFGRIGGLFSSSEEKKQISQNREKNHMGETAKNLAFGEHNFSLCQGEQTPWLSIPGNAVYDIQQTNPESQGYKVYFHDGTIVYAKPNSNIELPRKTEPKIKITADAPNQQFKVVVVPRKQT